MIPILIGALVLLALAVTYQEYRLQQALRTIKAAEEVAKKASAPCAHHMPVKALPSEEAARARRLVELLFPVHPWHGISPGPNAPEKVNAVIEIVPEDRVKFELDKESGMLACDRPQIYVNGAPVMYGFIPRSYCAELVGKACADSTKLEGILGDGDPIDICVLTEKDVSHGNILVRARPIGGLRMIDKDKDGKLRADDKIIAVLEGDLIFGAYTDISQLPPNLVDRLKSYFETYKQPPGKEKREVSIAGAYGREEAMNVIGFSLQDYLDHYGAPETRFEQLMTLLAQHIPQNILLEHLQKPNADQV